MTMSVNQIIRFERVHDNRVIRRVAESGSRLSTGISLEALRKTTKIVSQDSRCPGQNSNRAPTEHKSEAPPLQPSCLVFVCNDID